MQQSVGQEAPGKLEARFVCAVDSTKLLSADGFILDPRTPDPKSTTDFEFIVNHFCNDVDLFYVAPQTSKIQEHATPLLRLWQNTIIGSRPKQGGQFGTQQVILVCGLERFWTRA